MSVNEKRKLLLFFCIVFGMTLLLGIFLWIGAGNGADLTLLPAAQMRLPASGVMLAALLTRKCADAEERDVPVAFFATFSVVTFFMVILAIASVYIQTDIPKTLSNWSIYLLAFVGLIQMIRMGRQKREEWGFVLSKNWKKGVWRLLLWNIWGFHPADRLCWHKYFLWLVVHENEKCLGHRCSAFF